MKNIVNSKNEIHLVSYKDDSGYGTYFTTICGIVAFNFGSKIIWRETNKEVNCLDCKEALKGIKPCQCK